MLGHSKHCFWVLHGAAGTLRGREGGGYSSKGKLTKKGTF